MQDTLSPGAWTNAGERLCLVGLHAPGWAMQLGAEECLLPLPCALWSVFFLTTKIPAEKLEFTSLMTPGANWSAVQCMPHVGIEKCHVVFVCICALEGSDIRVVSCHAVIGPSDPFICMGVGWHALCWLAAVDVLATAIGMWYRHGWVWKSFPLCFLFSLHLTAEMHVVWISQCQCPTVSNFCRHSET